MRFSSLRNLLLVLLLVSGQWLNLAHADKHPGPGGGDQNCEFCVHAQGLAAGLAELPRFALPTRVHEAPPAHGVLAVALAAPAYYPIRGPPAQA